jgi:acyl-coenzyme A synthetase/AMP-(fatty) acid ligase
MHNPGLGTWMRKRRLKSPDKAALIYGDGSAMSYGSLADRADAVASLLSSRGVAKGDCVAFMGENSPEFLAALFGCVQVGAVFVPVNTRLAAPEILHVLADSRARAVIHDREYSGAPRPPHLRRRHRDVIETSALGEAGSRHPRLRRSGCGTRGSRRGHLHIRHHRSREGRGADPPEPHRGSRSIRSWTTTSYRPTSRS